MNGPVRKIEILSPFNQAIELTRLILFRPFDITKWLIVGFAAFLSGWLNSGGGSINPWSFRGWNTSSAQAPQFQFQSFNLDHAGVFLLILIAVLAIFIFAIAILWLWVTSRGRFIFIDCLVRNRAAIAEPWREYYREGNRFFLFLIVLIVASIAILALLGGFVFGSLMLWRNYHISITPALSVFVPIASFAWVAFAAWVTLIFYFMPPASFTRPFSSCANLGRTGMCGARSRFRRRLLRPCKRSFRRLRRHQPHQCKKPLRQRQKFRRKSRIRQNARAMSHRSPHRCHECELCGRVSQEQRDVRTRLRQLPLSPGPAFRVHRVCLGCASASTMH